jgi:hypothetical protein
MSCAMLPAAYKQLLHFQARLHRHLAGSPAGPATRLLRQYASWHQLPRLRARATACSALALPAALIAPRRHSTPDTAAATGITGVTMRDSGKTRVRADEFSSNPEHLSPPAAAR